MAFREDMAIQFICKTDGTYELRVFSNEGYDVHVEQEIGPEEMIAVASLIDQFKGIRGVKELLRGAFRAQVARAERELAQAQHTAQTIPDRERKLRELRKAVVA